MWSALLHSMLSSIIIFWVAVDCPHSYAAPIYVSLPYHVLCCSLLCESILLQYDARECFDNCHSTYPDTHLVRVCGLQVFDF